MKSQKTKDLEILEALYLGNHLSENELERAAKLIYLLNQEIKLRVKWTKNVFYCYG